MSSPLGREAELFARDPATCMTLLRAQPVGRLVLGGSEPQVIPVNFVVADNGVAFRTATDGAAAAPAGAAVMFEVDMFDGRTHFGWSVSSEAASPQRNPSRACRRGRPDPVNGRCWSPSRP